MGVKRYRQELGEHFSEGSRLLWVALADSCGGSQAQMRRRLTGQSGEELRPGVVSRWLYGDHRPGLRMVLQLKEAFGIPIEAWHQSPTEPFAPPTIEEQLAGNGTDG